MNTRQHMTILLILVLTLLLLDVFFTWRIWRDLKKIADQPFPNYDVIKKEYIASAPGEAQFIEPISYEERFKNSETVDDFIKNA